MTDTLDSLAEDALSNLQGTGVVNDQIVTLTAGITPTSLTISVDRPSVMSSGMIEIGTEQIYVSGVSGSNVTVPPWGRGWRGTTASSHPLNSAVRVSPAWPRSVLYRQINNELNGLYPMMFAVKTVKFSTTAYPQYELPSDAEAVLDVGSYWTRIDGWSPVTRWDVDYLADTTIFPSGKMITLNDALWPGSTIKVTYAAKPSGLVNPGDLFTSTGLPASMRDVVVLGACLRLFPWADAARIPDTTIDTDALSQSRPYGSAVSVGKYFSTEYQRRLTAERAALNAKYGSRAHRIG